MAGTRRASSYEFQFRRRGHPPRCWNTSRHPRLTRLLRRRGSLKSLKRSGCCARIGKDNRIFPSTTSSRAPRCNRTRQACPKGWIARGASSRLRQDVSTRRAMVSRSNWFVRCACVEDRFPAPVVPAAASPSESNIASFTAPEFPHMRLLACETCKAYLLVVDLERDPAAIPEVDELAGLSSGPLGSRERLPQAATQPRRRLIQLAARGEIRSLVWPAVFKTVSRDYVLRVGSIPASLRHDDRMSLKILPPVHEILRCRGHERHRRDLSGPPGARSSWTISGKTTRPSREPFAIVRRSRKRSLQSSSRSRRTAEAIPPAGDQWHRCRAAYQSGQGSSWKCAERNRPSRRFPAIRISNGMRDSQKRSSRDRHLARILTGPDGSGVRHCREQRRRGVAARAEYARAR